MRWAHRQPNLPTLPKCSTSSSAIRPHPASKTSPWLPLSPLARAVSRPTCQIKLKTFKCKTSQLILRSKHSLTSCKIHHKWLVKSVPYLIRQSACSSHRRKLSINSRCNNNIHQSKGLKRSTYPSSQNCNSKCVSKHKGYRLRPSIVSSARNVSES